MLTSQSAKPTLFPVMVTFVKEPVAYDTARVAASSKRQRSTRTSRSVPRWMFPPLKMHPVRSMDDEQVIP